MLIMLIMLTNHADYLLVCRPGSPLSERVEVVLPWGSPGERWISKLQRGGQKQGGLALPALA